MADLPTASSVEQELWRRAQRRREVALLDGSDSLEHGLLALLLSMARLAAQQDARALAHDPLRSTDDHLSRACTG